MVVALFHAAQPQGARILILRTQTNGALIKRPRARKVAHPQHRMAAADDVEGRFKIGFWKRHDQAVSRAQLRHLVGAGGQGDVFGFHVKVEAVIATISADATILYSAKWGWQVANVL